MNRFENGVYWTFINSFIKPYYALVTCVKKNFQLVLPKNKNIINVSTKVKLNTGGYFSLDLNVQAMKLS